MVNKPSLQQQQILDAPLEPMAIVACAGSGKTKTAVQRLSIIRGEIEQSRSHVALLSFSNVAVETFRKSYIEKSNSISSAKDRITIDTFDGFITSHILRPHAYRTMGCKKSPFLLTGTEPFLQNKKFKYWYETLPGSKRSIEGADINNIAVSVNNDGVEFSYSQANSRYVMNNGVEVTKRLGLLGAYTHELGKYWALYTLIEQPGILRVLANRYPHIIVDEAQDLGELHQTILELLIEQGVKVTLIGDPNQAIYEFAGATGKFITTFNTAPENKSYGLTVNYRSITPILDVANAISGRADKPHNVSNNDEHGAYYSTYDAKDRWGLVNLFDKKIQKSGLLTTNSAVLCRGSAGINKLRDTPVNIGQGKIKLLVLAAIKRDKEFDFQGAFKLVSSCIVGLLVDTPENLSAMIINPSRYPEVRGIRQDIWIFVRSIDEGLPSASLQGSTVWHGLVKKRLINFLNKVEQKYGYSKVDNLGRKLAKTGLIDEPLIPNGEVSVENRLNIRIDTVHQVKGESLDAVLYMASKSHIESMLDGVNTEVGRIGYVAVTRAKNLFILGVPKNALGALEPKIKAIGLKKLEDVVTGL